MEVRDFKTSEEARTFEEASIQVRLYAAGLKSLGRPVGSGSIARADLEVPSNHQGSEPRYPSQCTGLGKPLWLSSC
jgi:hypothetical protein